MDMEVTSSMPVEGIPRLGDADPEVGADGRSLLAESDHAKRSACEMYRLSGDLIQITKHGCDGLPAADPEERSLLTMPNEKGSPGFRNDIIISEALRYFVLALLLLTALIVIIVCCIRCWNRISDRRAALQQGAGSGGLGQGQNSLWHGWNQNGDSCSPMSQRFSYWQSRRVAPSKLNYKFNIDNCHNCREELNMI